MISQRQQAALNEYLSNQKAKLGELSRVKYEPKPRETKKEAPAPKPQPKAQPKADPPPPPPVVEQPPKPEKDNEFWNYYDKKATE